MDDPLLKYVFKRAMKTYQFDWIAHLWFVATELQ